MANTLLTRSEVSYEGLRVFKNLLGFTSRVTRTYDNRFAQKGAKIGDTLSVRKPPRYIGRTGDGLQPEATTESSVPVVIDTLFGVDTEFSSTERQLSLDDYSNRILKPKLATIANKVDADGARLTKKIWNAVGTPGTQPTTIETYLNSAARLTDNCAPDDDERYGALTPWAKAKLITGTASYFQPAADIARQYRRGEIGMLGGIDWFETQNVYTHTNGAYVPSGSAIEVKGANQSGSTLLTDGYTSAAFKEGDVFTIEGVYGVNPQTRESTGQLQQFRITADTTYAATDLSLPIEPAIVLSGPFQNVTNAPADNADLTFHSSTGRTYKEMLAFHRGFATLVVVDQENVGGFGTECDMVTDPDSGLALRSTTFYSGEHNKVINRLEILYGWAILYGDWACRVSGL
jgi:hypothetical protein